MGERPDPSALLESMAEALYVVDRDRTITFWNGEAGRLTGYGADQAVGRFCGDGLLNHTDEYGVSMCGRRCPLSGTMTDGEPRTVRMFAHLEGGRVVPLRVTARALRDESGDITGAVETFADDSSMAAVEQRMRLAERLAVTDPLTGLGNRRTMEHRLAVRLWTAAQETFAAIVVDIDHFKAINDTHGHAVGDQVLTAVARAITRAVRHDDDVIRSGGDEFLVLANAATAGELKATATRVRVAIAQTVVDNEGADVPVTASVGGALSREGDTAQSIVCRADSAMLEAKRGGRNASVVAPHRALDR